MEKWKLWMRRLPWWTKLGEQTSQWPVDLIVWQKTIIARLEPAKCKQDKKGFVRSPLIATLPHVQITELLEDSIRCRHRTLQGPEPGRFAGMRVHAFSEARIV